MKLTISKAIIIKSNTDKIINQLVDELSDYPNIRYTFRKINGEKNLVIKCYNYYDKFAKESKKNFYGNYIYLYTCISLLLSDLIIENHEMVLVNRILKYNYFYFGKTNCQEKGYQTGRDARIVIWKKKIKRFFKRVEII